MTFRQWEVCILNKKLEPNEKNDENNSFYYQFNEIIGLGLGLQQLLEKYEYRKESIFRSALD